MSHDENVTTVVHAASGLNIDHMIDNPTAYGFEWKYGDLHRGEKKDVLVRANVPYPFFSNVCRVDLVRSTFGDAFVLAVFDGTSVKVITQRARRDIINNPTITDRELQRLCIQRMLGIRKTPSARTTTITVEKIVREKVYAADDDTEFATLAEMRAYNIMLRVDAELAASDDANDNGDGTA